MKTKKISFDLERWQKGDFVRVETVSGEEVKHLTLLDGDVEYPLVGVVGRNPRPSTFTRNGTLRYTVATGEDLALVVSESVTLADIRMPERKSFFGNYLLADPLDSSYPYPSREEYIAACKAEWELVYLRDSEFYRNGWKPDWSDPKQSKHCICPRSFFSDGGAAWYVQVLNTTPSMWAFQDEETATRFFMDQKDLLKVYAKKLLM